jgi:hypothetical protein
MGLLVEWEEQTTHTISHRARLDLWHSLTPWSSALLEKLPIVQ